MELTSHSQLVARLRIHEALSPLLVYASIPRSLKLKSNNSSIEDRDICHFRAQALLCIIVLNEFVELYLYEIVVVIGRDSL